MKKIDERGFTLIELLITIGISSIVVMLVFSFFANNVKVFDILEDEMEIQHQEQFVLDFMTERLMQCSSINQVKDKDNNNVTDTSQRVNIKKIVLNGIELNGEIGGYIFQLNLNSDRNSYDLKYGILSSGNYANMEIANYIDKIEIEPVPTNLTYSKAKGIILYIYVKKGESYDEISTQVTFRNNNKEGE